MCVSLVQVGTSEFLLELDRGILHHRASGPHFVWTSVIRRRSIWSGVLCHWGGSNSFARGDWQPDWAQKVSRGVWRVERGARVAGLRSSTTRNLPAHFLSELSDFLNNEFLHPINRVLLFEAEVEFLFGLHRVSGSSLKGYGSIVPFHRQAHRWGHATLEGKDA